MVYPSDNKLYSNTQIHQPNKISYMNTLDDTNDQRQESMKQTSEIKQSYQNSVIKEISDEIS